MAQLVMAAACIPAVVEQYSDMVLRIAYQNMQSRADAEDVAQDVFLRLLGQPAFADETHLKAWLIRVTINRCKDVLKSAWRRKTVPIEQDWPTMDNPDHAIMEELFQLKPDERDILYLFYYEKYTIAEIAQMLGKNLNTVNSRLSRARKKLRDILTEGDTDHG
ncbi:MAG: sigma-70 family RNA polymerase sigma factor [Ruminococcaceae bacterium]|nr:sigma-70 family RNA polymerase sigma factor [Oscillospiraceae bacterium]